MIKRRLAALVLIAALPFAAHAADTATLTVTIHGVSDAGGDIRMGVYDEAGYKLRGAKPIAGKKVHARGSNATIVFEDLPPGVYAVKGFQDTNNNGSFDVGLRGVEPFGISNDQPATLGLPPFDDAKFTVKAGANSIELTLH